MDERRLKIHNWLCDILGSNNVYYQPPESVKMQYDAIRYKLTGIPTKNADNNVYTKNLKYEIIYIHKQINDDVIDKLSDIGSYNTTYIKDNLYHDVFTIYI